MPGYSSTVIEVNGSEDGTKTTGIQEVWHDPDKNQTLAQALAAYENSEFLSLDTAGSTGLATGAYWSHFRIQNTSTDTVRVQFEYVDHQLIALEAFDKASTETTYRNVANLSLEQPFTDRDVEHTRFVFELILPPSDIHDVFVKYSSEEMGYVFPSLRIWQPEILKSVHARETSLVAFLFGGFFVMSLFSLVAGATTGERMFFIYSGYSISKIIVWSTVFGFTHRFLITDQYSWSYMSAAGGISIFLGLLFSRSVLESGRYTPKLDFLLRLLIGNSLFLILCAIFRFNALAVISMTVALLLFPVVTIIAAIRWRQGSLESLVYGLAWSLLILGLVVQALRDIGFVPHNFFNYYWPPVASFVEMLTIMVAMGIRVKHLRVEKDYAELNYRKHLERSKASLEELVDERTKELAEAKKKAELEARTDALTGLNNRRNFVTLANARIGLAQRKQLQLCMLMLDIDHFKSVNDNYGHSAGDAALLAFSREVSNTIRDIDIFGRLGGEEFALLLHEDHDGAIELAERIRATVESIRMDGILSGLTITVSIGLAHFEKNDTVDTLLRKADTALYCAKEQGRNRVVEYVPPQSDLRRDSA